MEETTPEFTHLHIPTTISRQITDALTLLGIEDDQHSRDVVLSTGLLIGMTRYLELLREGHNP